MRSFLLPSLRWFESSADLHVARKMSQGSPNSVSYLLSTSVGKAVGPVGPAAKSREDLRLALPDHVPVPHPVTLNAEVWSASLWELGEERAGPAHCPLTE